MGCDGGTIPRRDELVRIKKKPEQKDKESELEFRWRHCALTQQRLEQPIVMCALGRLYSKQAVIEHLLEKGMPEAAKHIKSMKDIKELKLTENPAYVDQDKKAFSPGAAAPYICKLIGLEMSGKFRFVALWTCGCVMSERALKQIKGKVCAICQTPFSVEDVIVLNGNEEDLELLQAKKEMRATKNKKAKKSKDKKEIVETKVNNEQQEEIKVEPSTSKAIKTSVTSVTKNKLVANKRILAAKDLADPELKRLKTDFSVSKDPKASDVYKSLFTTHRSEQQQSRAHWVTYNPFYN